MKQGYVAAIDIGTTKIVAIIGKKNEQGTIEVVGLGRTESRGVARGEVINIDNTVSSINKAVAIAQTQANVKISDVYVGIAGKHIRCSQNRGYITRETHESVIAKEDVEKLIKDQYNVLTNPGEEIIHVLPQTYLVDNEYDVTDPIGMVGRRLEANFHMVVGKVDSVNYIKRSIAKSGLIPKGIILEPLASAESVLADDEKEVGVILVDIGGGTSDIAVYYENIIRHTAVIPFGGKVITNDIKEGCKILERQAEQLKVVHGQSLMDYADSNKIISVSVIKGREPKEISLKTLAGIIQARMEEIIDAVIFEVEASGVVDKIGAGIVLTGGGALLKNLRQLVAFKTGMDTRIGVPNELIKSEIENLNNPMFATSVGLLMKGFNNDIEADLLNVDSFETEFKRDIPSKETKIVETNTKKHKVVKNQFKKEKKNEPIQRKLFDTKKIIVDKLSNFFDVDEDNDDTRMN
jgi:cell division protein FtsA